jgi:hypothetical protein
MASNKFLTLALAIAILAASLNGITLHLKNKFKVFPGDMVHFPV